MWIQQRPCHAITHVPDSLYRRVTYRHFDVRRIPAAWQRSDAPIDEVLSGKYCDHAIERFGSTGINASNFCVTIGTAQNGQMGHLRELEIRDVAALSLEEARIFNTSH
jgi:hypothetical protein